MHLLRIGSLLWVAAATLHIKGTDASCPLTDPAKATTQALEQCSNFVGEIRKTVLVYETTDVIVIDKELEKKTKDLTLVVESSSLISSVFENIAAVLGTVGMAKPVLLIVSAVFRLFATLADIVGFVATTMLLEVESPELKYAEQVTATMTKKLNYITYYLDEIKSEIKWTAHKTRYYGYKDKINGQYDWYNVYTSMNSSTTSRRLAKEKLQEASDKGTFGNTADEYFQFVLLGKDNLIAAMEEYTQGNLRLYIYMATEILQLASRAKNLDVILTHLKHNDTELTSVLRKRQSDKMEKLINTSDARVQYLMTEGYYHHVAKDVNRYMNAMAPSKDMSNKNFVQSLGNIIFAKYEWLRITIIATANHGFTETGKIATVRPTYDLKSSPLLLLAKSNKWNRNIFVLVEDTTKTTTLEEESDLEFRKLLNKYKITPSSLCQRFQESALFHKEGNLWLTSNTLTARVLLQRPEMNYHGCYADILSKKEFSMMEYPWDFGYKNTQSTCLKFCLTQNHGACGVRLGRECWCGSDCILGETGGHLCSTNCEGDSSQTCGGAIAKSVFTSNRIEDEDVGYSFSSFALMVTATDDAAGDVAVLSTPGRKSLVCSSSNGKLHAIVSVTNMMHPSRLEVHRNTHTEIDGDLKPLGVAMVNFPPVKGKCPAGSKDPVEKEVEKKHYSVYGSSQNVQACGQLLFAAICLFKISSLS